VVRFYSGSDELVDLFRWVLGLRRVVVAPVD
jgi:hypothetical protein